MYKFDRLTVCLDMYGCPNRCRHCWLGVTPNGHMDETELKYAAEAFRPYTSELEIFDWYREPDYRDNYREMWELTKALSDVKTPHFELISYWRAARDESYIRWLKDMGVKICQLTLFGGEEKTDFYVGRKGAYGEVIRTIEVLLNNEIAPRIQVFINRDNIDELPKIEALIEELHLHERCAAFGAEFTAFVHQGTCDGENEKLYDIRVTEEDLAKIPSSLAKSTMKHFGKKTLKEVFGRSERELCAELKEDHSTKNFVEKSPVLYVDKSFDVYPNYTTPAPFWRLGNLKTDGAEKIIEIYAENRTLAQRTRLTVPLAELVRFGDPDSGRLFSRGDYILYLLNNYCRNM